MTTSPSDATNPADSGGRVVDIEIERELDEMREYPADDREDALDLLGAFVDAELMR